jgi:hypothetical protein
VPLLAQRLVTANGFSAGVDAAFCVVEYGIVEGELKNSVNWPIIKGKFFCHQFLAFCVQVSRLLPLSVLALQSTVGAKRVNAGLFDSTRIVIANIAASNSRQIPPR